MKLAQRTAWMKAQKQERICFTEGREAASVWIGGVPLWAACGYIRGMECDGKWG